MNRVIPAPLSSSLLHKGLATLILLITFGLLLGATPVHAAGESRPLFSDLNATNENYGYVAFLHNKVVIDGFPDGTFRPYGTLTRSQAAKMLVIAAGAPLHNPDRPTYSDVSPEHWAYLYIETATRMGLLTGYPDGTFQPERQLTRAETAVILYRVFGADYAWSGESLAVDLPSWAADAANNIIDAGLLGVDAAKRFQPDWATTRIEFARAVALLHTIHAEWRAVPLKATLVPKAGTVQLQKADHQPAKVSGPTVLDVDDVVITGANGEAEIRFEDGSGILLTANSEMKIQKLIGSLFILPDGTTGSAVENLEVQFSQGSMFGALATRGTGSEAIPQTPSAVNWSMFPALALAGDNWEAVGYSANATLAANGSLTPEDMLIDIDSEAFKKLPPWKQLQLKKVRVKVNMPHGVAAVRGSFWKIQLEQIGDRIREIINFIHGDGEVHSGDYHVPIKAGETTAIEQPGAPPATPRPMSQEERQEWLAMKTWVMERIQEIQEKLATPPAAPPPAPAGQQPPQGQESSPPSPETTRILESLQELLDYMETLEKEYGLTPVEQADDDDDGGGTGPGGEEPDPGGDSALKVKSGWISTAVIQDFYDLTDFHYHINIQFNQGVKVNGTAENKIRLSVAGKEYYLDIFGIVDGIQETVPVDANIAERYQSTEGVPLAVSQLDIEVTSLDPAKHYYARLVDENNEIVERYNLTPFGFATFDMTELLGERGDAIENGFIGPFVATLTKKTGSQQLHTVFLDLQARRGEEETYSVTAALPLLPSMTPGEWSLTDIKGGYFGDFYYPEITFIIDSSQGTLDNKPVC